MLFPDDLDLQCRVVREACIQDLGPLAMSLDATSLRDLVSALLEERATGRIGSSDLRGKVLRRFAGGLGIGLETAAAVAGTMTFQEARKHIADRLSGTHVNTSLGFTISQSSMNNKYAPLLRPVAHLWAAHLRRRARKVDESFPCHSDQLIEFLREAEDVRVMAERRRSSPTSNVPIMEPGAALSLPSGLGILEATPKT